MTMEIKLYEIEYGNGWNGCRSNSGKELVLAEDMKSAKKILSEHYNVKIGHIGKALRVPFLQSNKNVAKSLENNKNVATSDLSESAGEDFTD
jgi:hypothetical protein